MKRDVTWGNIWIAGTLVAFSILCQLGGDYGSGYIILGLLSIYAAVVDIERRIP